MKLRCDKAASSANRRKGITVPYHFFRFALFLLLAAVPFQLRGQATLSLTTTTCPGGTQGASYSGCTLVASGGTPPYKFSVDTTGTYAPLPEGMVLNSNTGVISSAQIGGEGTYVAGLIVTDNAAATSEKAISFAMAGSNAFMSNIFPASSIFHHRVDAATTGLPVDASPAAPIYSGYLTSTIKPFFGGSDYLNFPNGIPAFQVPYNQTHVNVSTTLYQSYFTNGPIPANAPVEGTAVNVPSGDGHVLIYQQAGGGNPPSLWEMWQGQLQAGGSWTDSSNALWPNVSSNALTPQGTGTSDAAGLPVAPLLLNADEVIGTGTPSAPNGTVRHPTRFTLNHGLNYWVWPATQSAGVGSCSAGSGTIATENLISQSSPPVSCTFSGAFGEIYRLKASVSNPACAATSPQASIIITGFRNYGIIMSDNGSSGGLIGTPDSRWSDSDLSCLRNLTLADFEPVNVSSLQLNPDSGATPQPADETIYRPSNGTWFVLSSKNPGTATIQQWGTSGDIAVRGDFDGDGINDFAVFRPSSGTWYIIPSSNPSSPIVKAWGASGDIPVPGDYDGDGKTDFAVFRPSNGAWYVIPSSNAGNPIVKSWGINSDVPVPGDYDGDGITDFAVFRPSNGTWYILPSSHPSSPTIKAWGTTGDIPVPGDYDGDRKTDFAIFRPSNNLWYIMPSSSPSNPVVRAWGTAGDAPVPADYDGDGKTDIGIWRSSNGTWYVLPSSTTGTSIITPWGTSGDVPLERPVGQ